MHPGTFRHSERRLSVKNPLPQALLELPKDCLSGHSWKEILRCALKMTDIGCRHFPSVCTGRSLIWLGVCGRIFVADGRGVAVAQQQLQLAVAGVEVFLRDTVLFALDFLFLVEQGFHHV